MAQYQPMYDSFNRLPERYVPTARIGVSANVRLPGGDVDLYTGQLKPDHVRRHRTQGEKLEAAAKSRAEEKEQRRKDELERERQKGGIRIEWWKGMIMLGALVALCGMSLIYQLAVISSWQDEINLQENRIDDYRQANMILEEELAAASDPAVICYAASQELHMVPAESAKAIELVAVDTRPLETAKRQRLMAMAAQQAEQTQNTPVPMSASN